MRLEDQRTLQGEAGEGEMCQMQISQGPPHSPFLQHQCSPSTLFLGSLLVPRSLCLPDSPSCHQGQSQILLCFPHNLHLTLDISKGNLLPAGGPWETRAHSCTHLWLLWTLLGLYEGWYADPHPPLGWSRDSPEVRGATVVKAFVKSKGRRSSPSPGVPAVSCSPRSPPTGCPWSRCQPEVYPSHWPLE